ncbi:helix-turn-helix domain-containing protein [Streptomyces sp. O3]
MAQSPHQHTTGEAIAAARRERGWTQEQLADVCGFSQSTISRLERGRQSARDMDVLAMVAERLGLRRSAVGLADEPTHHAELGSSASRRQLLGAAVSLGVAAGTGTRERPVNPAVVGHLRSLRATLVQSDSLYGPCCVIGAVRDHLAVIQRQLLPVAKGNLHSQLLQAAAEWAEFAGWLHEDLGQVDTGLWWSDRAMEWAQEADDPLRQAFILMRKAQQSVGLMQEQRAIGLASAALRVRGDVPARVRGSAYLQQAHGHSLAKEDAAAFRALDAAYGLIVNERDAPTDDLGGYCVVSYADAQRAAVNMRLGKPDKAVATYQKALLDWPDAYQRERGLHLARLANAYAANRCPDAACGTALEALEITRETESRRTRSELRKVITVLAPWRRTPMVRELSEAIATV